MKTKILLLLLLTLALNASAQRIAVLSDIHVTPGNANASKLHEAVDEINAADFDIVVVNGDLTNEGSDEQLDYVKAILDNIRHRTVVLPGNHENNWSQSATTTFPALWGNDRFLAEVDSLVIIGINCGPYMKMGDGHVKQEDLHWLHQALAPYDQRRVLSFNHYPIRKDDLDNYLDYQNALAQYPVIAHINGHYHVYKDYMVGDIPCFMVRALDTKDGNYGYTIIEIDGDRLRIDEKLLSKSPTTKFAIDINTKHAPCITTEVPAFEVPEGFDIQKLWTDSASIFTRLGFDADRVYFGNSLGVAKAVDKRSHRAVWEYHTANSLFSRPVALADGSVAVPHSLGISILDASTGNMRLYMPTAKAPYVADGIALGDSLYIQGGYKRMECRRSYTGELVWRYDSINNYCQAAPDVDGTDLVFGAWDTYLRCVDINDGHLRWKWNNGKSANMLGPGNVVPVIAVDKVITVAPDRYMTALDRKTGQMLWRDNSHKYRESLGHNADRTAVYAKTMDGELVAVDATTPDFNELWLLDLGLGYEHAPCIVAESEGIVYAGSRRGILTAVDPATRSIIWQLPLGVSEINGIDIDPTDNSVWVSLIEGTVWRIAPTPRP